jgi:ribosome-associated GTPase EngA
VSRRIRGWPWRRNSGAWGSGEPHPISAIHGAGTGDLLDRVVSFLPPTPEVEEPEPIQLAIIGRPNVGKSSLLNAVCGENRAIVSPIRGTTRDTIDTTISQDGQTWKLVDTAGIRRRRSVDYGPEYFGINRSFKAIERSDVCVLVIDALDGVTEQDQRVAGRIEEDGRACVVVVNKWDAIEKDSHTMPAMEKELRAKLYFLDWAPMLFTSALTGQRVRASFPWHLLAVEQHRRRVSTSVVNEVLQEALRWRSPPTSRGGRQGRLYYGTQVASRPPSFTLFVNEPRLFGETYRRYVERQIREGLGFEGSPIRLFWRGKQQRDAEKDLARQQSRSAGSLRTPWTGSVRFPSASTWTREAQKPQLAAAAGSPPQAGLDPGVPDDAGAGRTPLADGPGGSAAAAHLPEWIALADLATGVAPAVGPGLLVGLLASFLPAGGVAPASLHASRPRTAAGPRQGQPAPQRSGLRWDVLRWGPLSAGSPVGRSAGGDPPLRRAGHQRRHPAVHPHAQRQPAAAHHPPEALVWALSWWLRPLGGLGWPMERLGFTLLLALRFLPLVQEEFQNLLRSLATRAVNLGSWDGRRDWGSCWPLVSGCWPMCCCERSRGPMLCWPGEAVGCPRTGCIRPAATPDLSTVLGGTGLIVLLCLRWQGYGAL